MATPWPKAAMANGFGGVEFKDLHSRHGQPLPKVAMATQWPIDLEGWNLKISKVAMAEISLAVALPWPAMAESCHGHAMASCGEDGVYRSLHGWPWLAMALIWPKSRVLDMSLRVNG